MPITPEHWGIQADPPRTPDDTARYEPHLGHASLLLPGGFAWAKGAELRNGTIEADVATSPKGAFFGVAFHVTSPDQFENIFFRPGSSGTVQYSPSWFNMNAWQFYSGSGTQVVFARTTISAPRAGVRKMWVGYSDDVVVYLNGQPVYAGRNARSSREPNYYGWFYPYADAVYLPLHAGRNALVLAVSETFGGWGFLCAFDP